jgi:hypothetical protein
MRSSMKPPRPVLAGMLMAGLAGGMAAAADLPSAPMRPPIIVRGPSGDGYRLPQWPVRPRPLRFDAYGYPVPGPVVPGAPDSPAVSGGCPAALEPVYDRAGNLAGYAPFPNCR